MPGRRGTPVSSLFTYRKSKRFKGSRAICKFCFEEVADNGTRKEKHIEKCSNCSKDIKKKYLKAKFEKNGSTETAVVLEKLSPAMSKKPLPTNVQGAGANAILSTSACCDSPSMIHIIDSDDSEKNDMQNSPSLAANIAPIFKPGFKDHTDLSSKYKPTTPTTELEDQPSTSATPKQRKRQTKLKVDKMSSEENVSVDFLNNQTLLKLSIILRLNG